MVHVDCGFLCGVVDVSHSRWRSCPGRDESGRVVPPEKRSTALINVVRGGGEVSVYVCVMPSTEHCRLCRGRGTGDAMDVWSSQRRGGIHHRSNEIPEGGCIAMYNVYAVLDGRLGPDDRIRSGTVVSDPRPPTCDLIVDDKNN